jgi:hypothetical protein
MIPRKLLLECPRTLAHGKASEASKNNALTALAHLSISLYLHKAHNSVQLSSTKPIDGVDELTSTIARCAVVASQAHIVGGLFFVVPTLWRT